MNRASGDAWTAKRHGRADDVRRTRFHSLSIMGGTGDCGARDDMVARWCVVVLPCGRLVVDEMIVGGEGRGTVE